ncbi:DUF1015 domain-containing protein [Desulforamulus aquiferis]|uniref:DUF1015 domain-containing protein n=1 Tax=Desulforamulus aquiferis TaxID=1397668 RepID=A0AAW7ZAG0_9FIRM|nr:DUF1015 domain-containing protein [Desulforamulus aquiferis]MDO7786311.1 DUF1015 domain-containing protein [Desulforamulus aquiferis]RYD04990.1 hypothetical protein N752_11540 [Desulforamulus aquiferis]
MSLKNLGIKPPQVLLPKKNVDLTKWAVVACDQYTSQPEYWAEVENLVGEEPSTLKLVFPEVYLEEAGAAQRVANINDTMKKYLDQKQLMEAGKGFIYIDRKTAHTKSRKGLLITIDLEQYDFNPGAKTLIRATEGTVLDRLPPRIRIRENAPIEVPHVMLLIDDPEKSVIEPLALQTDKMEKVYDFDLMMNGGHIEGYRVADPNMEEAILDAFTKLAKAEAFASKYGVGPEKDVLLFAAGDGNHSLATAKSVWENIKGGLAGEDFDNHPARYAMVEVVNVHDQGLTFEPIHRIVFNVNGKELLQDIVQYCARNNSEAYYQEFSDQREQGEKAKELTAIGGHHVIPYICGTIRGLLVVQNPKYNLAVATLQSALNDISKNKEALKIDYIHGEDVLSSLASQEGAIGFYLEPMDKHDLFKTVILDGVLPRKTFSMGEAEEKRFYLECRKITKE